MNHPPKPINSSTPNYTSKSAQMSLTKIEPPYSLGATTTDQLNQGNLMVFEQEDADFDCPVKGAIQPKYGLPPERARELKRHIENSVNVIWLKDGRPIHRKNGNLIAEKGPNTLVLLRVDKDDQGEYTCLLNYTLVSKEARTKFKLYPSITFQLHVEPKKDMLPNTKPFISDPPVDTFVNRGSNATFNCNTIVTMSTPTIYWFKACGHELLNNRTCIERFEEKFKQVKFHTNEIPNVLIEYYLKGEHGQQYTIYNASDKDIGIYGCWAQNERGLDIKAGKLNILEKIFESQVFTTTTPPPSTTLTRVTMTTTTSKPTPQPSHFIQNQTINHPPKSVNSSTANYTSNSGTMYPNPIVEASHESYVSVSWAIFGAAFLMIFFAAIVACLFYIMKRQIGKDKKKSQSILPSPIVGNDWLLGDSLKNSIPRKDPGDGYIISRATDGFISGHLHQGTGQLMTQSICSRILDKEKNPSISSSNSNSDEASSLGKTMSTSSNGDNSRLFYLHTSNTTSTTVPMYDHPPSTGKTHHFAIIEDACVINPTYGFLRPEVTANDWAFPRRNLEKLNKIGEGQFGEVWRYIARQKDGSESLVAVKQLKDRAGLGDRERLELIAEIEIMKSVNNHPNVIKLLNYCIDEYEPILVIMEWAEHGKLQTYLRNCRSVRKVYDNSNRENLVVTSKELIKFSYHITKGMEYIASKGIIHRDLASRNILVSVDKICKVADFGFARRVSDDSAYERTTGNPVPIKWMAPEALAENKFTSKSDVFALGILMWEIVTLGGTPYENLTSEAVIKKVTSGERLEKPAHCKEEFFNIMAQCWLHDPVDRPTFKEIAGQLEELLLSENEYIELDQYPEHAYYNILNTEDKEIVHRDMVT